MDDQKILNALDDLKKGQDRFQKSLDGLQDTQDGFSKTQDGFQKSFDGFHKTQDGFQKSFDGFHKTQDGILKTLDRVVKTQTEHSKTLGEHSKILGEHTGLLQRLTVKVVEHGEQLDKMDEKMDRFITRPEFLEYMDKVMGDLRTLNEQRVITVAWVRRVEGDLESVKSRLQIA